MFKYYNKKIQNEMWYVKNERPEEIYLEPGKYYTKEEVEHYSRSSGMKNVQQKIARRILEIIDLSKQSKILDLGCGTGNTLQVYDEKGCNVVGLDIIPEMLEHAKEKGFETVLGDIRNLKEIFRNNEFDCIVSASALQWLKKKEDFANTAQGIWFVLKPEGRFCIQFYPYSALELRYAEHAFTKEGFNVKVIVDNENNPRKKLIFIVGKKNKN